MDQIFLPFVNSHRDSYAIQTREGGMKTCLLVVLLLVVPAWGQDAEEDTLDVADSWTGFDKVRHATFSFLWVLSTQYVAVNKLGMEEGEAFGLSAVSAASAGLLKEIYDSKKPGGHFSKRDLVANGVGICLASVVILIGPRR